MEVVSHVEPIRGWVVVLYLPHLSGAKCRAYVYAGWLELASNVLEVEESHAYVYAVGF